MTTANKSGVSSENGAETLIGLREVSIGYSGNPLVEHISLEIKRGDFFGLVGPNGAGKTTLLITMLGNIPPVAGNVERAPGLRIGYVPQRTRVDTIFPLSAVEMVRTGGMGPKADRRGWIKLLQSAPKNQAIAALDRVGMKFAASRPFRDLSGGQQQRVLIARALVRNPDLLVLDEPTAGMDIPSEHDLLDFVSRLNAEQGTSVIVVVHQISLVAGRANRIAIVNKDLQLFATGTAEQLLSGKKLSELYQHPMHVLDVEGHLLVHADAGRAKAAEEEKGEAS